MWLQQLPNGTSLHDVYLWADGIDNPDRDTGIAPTWSGITKGVLKFGGRVLTFDGDDDYIYYSTLSEPASAVTITFWFSTEDVGADMVIVALGSGNAFIDACGMDATKLVFHINGGTTIVETDDAYNDGAWHHCAMDTANELIYVDGAVVATSAGSLQRVTDQVLIGCRHNAGDYNQEYTGNLANIIVFNKTLTATQIAQMYNKHKKI